jgi:acylphosphatase
MPTDVRQYRVVGRVQGVGFRWFVRELARSLDLAGWVRNEPDGAVVVVAGGAPDVLMQLETALRAGPSGARVDQVDVSVPSQATHSETASVFSANTLPRPFQVVRAGIDA